MRQTFRATLGNWLLLVALPLALGIFVTFWAVRSGNLSPGLLLTVPTGLFALWSALRLVRTWMELDGHMIVAHVGGESYEVPWRQVVAAALGGQDGILPFLRLVTASRIYTFPVGTLAYSKIRDLVSAYGPPSALARAAVEQALAHPGAIVPCVDLRDGSEGSLRARVGTPQDMGSGPYLILLGAVLAIAGLRWGWGGVGLPGGLLLLLVGLPLVVRSGALQMDAEEISYHDRHRAQAMRWDEMSHIEVSADGRILVFYGRDRQLQRYEWFEVWGPTMWWGRDRRRCAVFLEAQAHRFGIPIRRVVGHRPGPGLRHPKGMDVSGYEEVTNGDLRREEDRRHGRDGQLPGFHS
jgi:hypothetical protein